MAKPSRTVERLQVLLIERLEAIPDPRGQVTDVHRGGVIWMGPGHEGGLNRTVCVVSDRCARRSDITRIVHEP
ncbi:hypothetical protein CLU95_4693 [Variovorax sp. 54]|nr:hypothetical protein CLU95_4693 [Variovorax sp. 54]